MELVNLTSITFPVYKLSDQKPTIDGGLSYYEFKTVGQESFRKRIIDDRALPGKTLARRRMLIPTEDKYAINKAIFFLGDLIKLAKSDSWFIDSTGLIFNYTKTKMVPLICRKIKRIHPIPEGTGKIIEVEGIPTRFKTLFSPPSSHGYCLLLQYNNGYLYYGTSEHPCKDTKRKI